MRAVPFLLLRRTRDRRLRILRVSLGFLGALSITQGVWAAPQGSQQQPPAPPTEIVRTEPQRAEGPPTLLAALIEEAQKNNPIILSAGQAAQAATHVAPQVSTLPDPQFTVQHFSVGSPRPF